MSEYRNSSRSHGGGRGGGGGAGHRRHKRGERGGGGRNNEFPDSPPSNDRNNGPYEYGEPPRMVDRLQLKNKWDDHAREHEEEELTKKGLLPPRNQRSSNYDRPSNDYQHESPSYDSYGGDRNGPSYENENGYDFGYEEDYGHEENRREQESSLNYPPVRRPDDVNYDLTPPQSMQSYDGRRDDDYRNDDYRRNEEYRNEDYRSNRSAERTAPCYSLEEEYSSWNMLDLTRELTRLQRRSDVIREIILNRSQEREQREGTRNYSPYCEDREFMQNVRDGESFYQRDDRGERDSNGFSPLGRQAYEAQQRKNYQGRGYIPAGRLDRYCPPPSRNDNRSDGSRRRDEERRDEGQRGERRDNHYSNGYPSSTGYSEAESRESPKKKKRNRKHRGPSMTSSSMSNSTFDSDDGPYEPIKHYRSSGYSTGGSMASETSRSSTIHENDSHRNHTTHHYRNQSMPNEMIYEEEPVMDPHPSSSFPSSLHHPSPPDILTPAKIVEMAAAAASQRADAPFSPDDEMTGDRGGPGGRGGRGGGGDRGRGGGGGGYGGGRGGGGGYRGGGGQRGRGGYRGGGGEYRGGGGREGYGGGGGGVSHVAAGLQSMNLGEEPEPLPFRTPSASEQEGYKAAAKPAPALREGKRKVHVISNVWQLEYEDRLVYRYDVSVGLEAIGNDGSSRIFSVNKGPKDDASVHERNELIREALKRGLEMYRILSRNGCIGVDGAAMMYANENLGGALKACEYKMKVPVEDLPEEVRKFIRNAGVKNVVIEVVAEKSFRIKDLSGQTSIDRSDMDQSVKQFFEVITSDHALSTHNYSFFSGGNLYRDDPDRIRMGAGNRFARDIGSGQERRDGMSKGFTLAEKNGSIIGALNIDVTTGTFWTEQRLLQTIQDINGWDRIQDARWDARAIKRTNDLIKNLRVSYTPPTADHEGNSSSSFDFIANGITAKTWSTDKGETKMEVRTIEQLTCKNAAGQEEPLYNKFSNANLIPALRSWPLIESKRARRRTDDPTKYDVNTEFFPIELLDVKANQRVPLKKQGADPERAMPVELRWEGTNKALEALNLFGDTRLNNTRNPIMDAFGIRVSRKPLETTGITRRMPNVTFNRDADVDFKTTFRTGQLQFHTPAHITTLVIAISDNQHRFDGNRFSGDLVNAAKRKLMRIDNTIVEICHPNKMHDRLKKISDDRKAGDPKLKKVVFMYIEPEASKRHDELKLFERRHCVVTQHLTMEIASKLGTSRPTMENVLLKLNVKGGGHNYNVNPEKFAQNLWMGEKTMIMGYDVWHPTGQTRAEKMADRLPEPSVVGFSFNGGVNPDSFIGDYHFQQDCKERVEDKVLNERIKWMLAVFERNRGVLPPLIIVTRDGISDGQYKHGMDELEALREGALEYAVSKARTDATRKAPVPDYKPNFIFVVATKRHHKRIYVEKGRFHDNMPAMTAVDDTITNPSLFEFFLQSHTPLQGMAKATKYTVLKDDVGTNQDAMQSLMGALCFEHQVSTNAISIPEPIYQSDEWAKRGAANMRKFRDIYGDQGQFKKGTSYDDLTTRLAYWKCDLAHVRVNA